MAPLRDSNRLLGLSDLRAQILKKNQSRLKFSISLENFNLDLKIFNLDLKNSPQKIGAWWVARLKFSISIENFKILNFFKIWAIRDFRREFTGQTRLGATGRERTESL